MEYNNAIGEKVINYNGRNGVITKVDDSGYIHIKFDGDWIDGAYMYDPFLNEDVRFEKKELQDQIDKEIQKINQKDIDLIKKSLAKDKNEDGSSV